MYDQLNLLIKCLNESNYLLQIDDKIKIALNDAQIYYSKIEFDLYVERGMWDFWYRVN